MFVIIFWICFGIVAFLVSIGGICSIINLCGRGERGGVYQAIHGVIKCITERPDCKHQFEEWYDVMHNDVVGQQSRRCEKCKLLESRKVY